MTMTIPGEQQLVFEAADATEFRALLGRILQASPLSCGQIAIKTGMPRSTAYSLPDTKRPGVPSNPEQVAAFVSACGLTNTQIDLVMDLWKKLNWGTEDIRAGGDKAVTGAPAPSASGTDTVRCICGEPHPDGVSQLAGHTDIWLGGELKSEHVLRRTEFSNPLLYSRRGTSWTELLHYVLGDERRTRHAVMLLIPVTLLLLGIVCALVFLAVKMPTTTPMVVAGLLSPLLLALRRNVRRPKRKLKADG